MRRKSIETECRFDMTPMIDVTFQLLIFFIVSMRFKSLEKKLGLALPIDYGLNRSVESIDETSLTLELEQVGAPVDPRPLRERSTLTKLEGRPVGAELASSLRAFIAAYPGSRCKVTVGEGVPHARVVELLDVLASCRWHDVTFTGIAGMADAGKLDARWREIRARLGDD